MHPLPSKFVGGLVLCLVLGSSSLVLAQESSLTIPHIWSCSNNERFITSGPANKLMVQWRSKSYEMQKEASLPGSMRFKHHDSGLDLVVIGPKAMLFNSRPVIDSRMNARPFP